MCRRENEENEEFQSQIILAGNQGTSIKWKVCEECLNLTTEFLLDNQDKYAKVRNNH